MGLRIACDLDGTLADLDGALSREAGRLFGAPVPDRSRLAARQRRALWSSVAATDDFWLTLDEVEPGAVARFAALSAARRWEVIFLTQRPPTAGDTSQRQTQRWLEQHGFARPSVFVVSGSRGKIAAALDLHAVIDDRPENALDVVADSVALSLLVWRTRRDLLPPGVSRVQIEVMASMNEALDRLTRLEQAMSAPQTMFDRFRQALPQWASRLTSTPSSVERTDTGDISRERSV